MYEYSVMKYLNVTRVPRVRYDNLQRVCYVYTPTQLFTLGQFQGEV